MPMEKGYKQCVQCKRKTAEEHLNGFGECLKEKCNGAFMRKIRKGMGPMFPAAKKKKGKFGRVSIKKAGRPKKKQSGSSEWRNASNVKKATPLDATPTATMDEERALTEKV